MPIRIDDVKRQRKERDRQFEPAIERAQGVLLGLDSADSAEVRNRPGFVWYRRPGSTSSAAQALNRKLLPVPGLPVILQRVPPTGSWEVVDVDANTLAQLDDYQGAYLDRHAREHEPGGNDPLYVYLRMITPLRTTPGTGVAVSVAPLVYDNAGTLTTFGGNNNLSLSSSVPGSGLARYVLVYLDPATNTLTTANGSTGPNGGAVALSFPAVPAGTVPSAYVRLAYGQTTITESDIVDGRLLLNGMRIGTGEYLTADGSVVGATSQAQDFGANGIEADVIAESTSAAGVTVDGVELKDGDIRDNTNETYGLFANIRTNLFSGGGSLYSHFRGSLPAGFSWAGSPFATPAVSYTSGSYLNSSVNNSGAFLQKSMSGNPNIVARVSVAVTFLEVGCRVDDGTNNNYAEWLLSISAVGVASLIARVALSGTPSSTSYDFNISAWDYITLALRYTGTAMQGFVINEEGEFFYAALKSGTFTPARAGIVNRSADAAARIAKYDWFQGDF